MDIVAQMPQANAGRSDGVQFGSVGGGTGAGRESANGSTRDGTDACEQSLWVSVVSSQAASAASATGSSAAHRAKATGSSRQAASLAERGRARGLDDGSSGASCTSTTLSSSSGSSSSDVGSSDDDSTVSDAPGVLGPLSLASWNMQGLLSGHRLEGPSMHLFRRRLRRIQRLLDVHNVVFLQETRATLAEVEILKAHFLGGALYGTCGTEPAVGGLISMVSRQFPLEYPRRELLTIIPGRASLLRCTSSTGVRLDLLYLHLTPHAQAGDPVRQLRRVRRWVRPRARAATIIAGDVNFFDAAEGRLNVATGRPDFAEEAAATEFVRLFPEFAEVVPLGFTHAQHRVEDGVALLARIDRCWASLPTPFLCSRTARASVLDLVAEGDGLSDHAPTGLRWEAAAREKLKRIADRIARHPQHPAKVDELCKNTVGYGNGDVWEQLQSHIGVMHLAAEELAKELHRPAPAEAASWRFHWMPALLRAVRRREWRSVRAVLARLPEDADFVARSGDGFRIRHEGDLADRFHAAATDAMLVERRRDVRAAPSEDARRFCRPPCLTRGPRALLRTTSVLTSFPSSPWRLRTSLVMWLAPLGRRLARMGYHTLVGHTAARRGIGYCTVFTLHF